ncbi:MAG: hypothetical protein ACRDMH_16220 [Solirubrobacterales bacterium]
MSTNERDRRRGFSREDSSITFYLAIFALVALVGNGLIALLISLIG